MADTPIPAETILTDGHHLQFSRIVTGYARAEMAFKSLLSRMIGAEWSIMLIVTAPYTAQNVRNVLKSVAKMLFREGDRHLDVIAGIIGTHKAHGKLRNDIGHNIWCEGTRPASIRPAYVDIRNERPDFMGFDDAETDYTIPELEKAATEVASITRRISKLYADPDFIRSIDEAIARVRTAREASEGVS